MGPIGVQEMIGIFLVALLLFGPKKLPELGRMLGRALHEFRRAKNELRSTFESHMHELEREVNSVNYPARTLPPSPDYSSVRYPSPYEEDVRPAVDINPAPAIEAGPGSDWHGSEGRPAENGHSPFRAPAVLGTVPRSNGTGSTHTAATDQEERLA